MQSPPRKPVPPPAPRVTDPRRVALVRDVLLRDEPLRVAFDRVTDLLARVIGVPVALVSIVDDERQHFRSCVGLPPELADGTPLSHSFCQLVVDRRAPLVVEDARLDPLVQANLAVEDLGVVAYAGFPIRMAGEVLGSLCVIDRVSREWGRADLEFIRGMAGIVDNIIALHFDRTTRDQGSSDRQVEPRSREGQLDDELTEVDELSRRLQRVQLDAEPEVGEFRATVAHRPGWRRLLLGGDFAAVTRSPAGELEFVLGDVSGHGPEAAALAIGLRASWRALRRQGIGLERVLAGLDAVVADTGLQAAVVVGRLTAGGEAAVASAGHPPPIVIDGRRGSELPIAPGPMLGTGGDGWAVETLALGQRQLMLYSGGLVEGRAHPGAAERCGADRLCELIGEVGSEPARLIAAVSRANGQLLSDDVAVLRVAAPPAVSPPPRTRS